MRPHQLLLHVFVVNAVVFHILSLDATLVAGESVTVAYWYGTVFALLQVHLTTVTLPGINMTKKIE
jgi:hypothetical protein